MGQTSQVNLLFNVNGIVAVVTGGGSGKSDVHGNGACSSKIPSFITRHYCCSI